VAVKRDVMQDPEALRALQRLAAIVSGSRDAIYAKDLEGVITDWNPAAERLFGYPADEAVGRPVTIIVPPDRHEEERETLRRVLAGEQVQHLLTERVRRDGSRLWVSLTVSPIHGEGGRPIGASSTARDVTQERRIDQERQRLAAIVRSASDAIIAMTADGVVTDFNAAAAAMFGMRPESIGGSIFDEVRADPSQLERRKDIVRRAGAGETLKYEATRLDAAGKPFILANTIGPTHDADGRIIGVAAIVRDITAQRKAQEQERWLAAIVDSSRDAILGFALDGTILSWNPAAARMFGVSDVEAVGRAGGDFFVKERRARRHVQLMKGIAAGEPFQDEPEQGVRHDGTLFDATVTGFPVRDVDGRVYAAAFVVRDVTEQKRLEEQLEQARRMEAVGRLAGGVAHDFNNLLTVITGYTGLLRGVPAGDSHELAEIERAARRATELTGQLLAFSRQRAAVPVLLDLRAVVDGVLPMLTRLIGEHIAIEVTGEQRLEPVLADAGQMEQVIINLATNARDAMPDGGTLTLATRTVDPGPEGLGRCVSLSVTDTGTGIPPELAEHVFEPFFTTKEQGRGTGLGLATVHGLVVQAGGRVSLQPAPGGGTRFEVLLPVAEGTAPVVHQALAGPDDLSGTESVLLCEDEAALRAMVERILTDAGYTVVAAPGGAEALEIVAARAEPFDVLVTDVIMPGLSGPEVAERLSPDGSLRTLFLSGYTADALGDRGELPPGSAFLEKPFSPTALLGALRALLDG
jgi:PAS domain S-box-containing protein